MRLRYERPKKPRKEYEPTARECRWYHTNIAEEMSPTLLKQLVMTDPEYIGYIFAQNYPNVGACMALTFFCSDLDRLGMFQEGYRNGRNSLKYNPHAFGHIFRVDPPDSGGSKQP